MNPFLLTLLSQPVETEEANRNSVLSTASVLIGVVLGLAALGALLHRWTKGWVERILNESRQTRSQLKTSNGKSVGTIVEDLFEKADRNYRTSLSALTLAQENSRRLDRHINEGHAPRRSEDERS